MESAALRRVREILKLCDLKFPIFLNESEDGE